MVKNPPTSAGDARDVNSIPSWKDPLEEGMSTCSSILPGKFHGQRTLTNNSPGATKSQTEHVCACTHTHTHTHTHFTLGAMSLTLKYMEIYAWPSVENPTCHIPYAPNQVSLH